MKDITVILNAHAEGFICGPTLRSLDVALSHVQGQSFNMIAILDNPCETTEFIFREFSEASSYTDIHIVKFGDLSQARNYAISRSDSKYLFFLDADDLFSPNWIYEAFNALEEAGNCNKKIICHPEINIFFEGVNSIIPNEYRPSSSQTSLEYYIRNPYDSLMAVPSSLFTELTYQNISIYDGYGYEDWSLNMEAQQLGWFHELVPNTFIAKRRRSDSLVVLSDTAKVMTSPQAMPSLNQINL